MNQIKSTTKKGFTIIEVVLVLAIAGLIFLVVFLAVPAMQRNRRDTQRKQDASRLQSAIITYMSNNRGAFPSLTSSGTASSAFITDYVEKDSAFNDPSTNQKYSITKATSPSSTSGDTSVIAATDAVGKMVVAEKSSCSTTEGSIKPGASIVVLAKTENGRAVCVQG